MIDRLIMIDSMHVVQVWYKYDYDYKYRTIIVGFVLSSNRTLIKQTNSPFTVRVRVRVRTTRILDVRLFSRRNPANSCCCDEPRLGENNSSKYYRTSTSTTSRLGECLDRNQQYIILVWWFDSMIRFDTIRYDTIADAQKICGSDERPQKKSSVAKKSQNFGRSDRPRIVLRTVRMRN